MCCIYCGNDNKDDRNFCSNCGTNLSDAPRKEQEFVLHPKSTCLAYPTENKLLIASLLKQPRADKLKTVRQPSYPTDKKLPVGSIIEQAPADQPNTVQQTTTPLSSLILEVSRSEQEPADQADSVRLPENPSVVVLPAKPTVTYLQNPLALSTEEAVQKNTSAKTESDVSINWLLLLLLLGIIGFFIVINTL